MNRPYLRAGVRRGLTKLRNIASDQSAPAALIEATDMVEVGLRYIRDAEGGEKAEWWLNELFSRSGAWSQHPELIATARTPEYWAAKLAESGIPIDAATIRETARQHAVFFKIEGHMLISPWGIDKMFEVRPPTPMTADETKRFQELRARLTKRKRREKGKR